MTPTLRSVFFLLLTLAAATGYAQKPNISYSSPQNYTAFTAITPLTPVNTGGAVPPSGQVTLGTGFSSVRGVTADGAGNVYVADLGANKVLKIPAGGGSTVVLGSGFVKPTGVAVDAAGNVYVADNGNSAIKEIPMGGGAIVTLGSGFTNPWGIALDAAGNIYVSDTGNNLIKKIAAGGGATTTIASGFNVPTGITVDGAGNVYVTDRGNNAIKKIPAGGGAVITVGSGNGNPNGVAIDAAGNIYYADTNNTTLIEIPAAGGSTIPVGSGLYTPTAVAVDGAGNIYIGDTGNGAVKEISTAWYHISPALPAGFIFNGNTGVISGTPIAGSPATDYAITARNLSGADTTTLNISVDTTPTMAAGSVSGHISGCLGVPSASPNIETFRVLGANLSGDITVTAPANFEVSLSAGSGYSNSVPLTPTGGTVNNIPVYVRSAAAAPAGNISGSVTLTSSSVSSQNVLVSATINPGPSVNPVPNQTVNYGMATAYVNFTGTANTFTWVNDTPAIGLAASGAGDIASFSAVNNGSNPVTATITATPAMAGFAYITTQNSNRVSVVNTITNEINANPSVNLAPTGVAASPDGSKVYIAASTYVSVINTATNTVITTIPVSSGKSDLALSTDGGRLYVATDAGSSGIVSVINTATNTVISTIPMDAGISGVMVSPDGSRVYTANQNSQAVSVINTATNTVIATINIGFELAGMAISHDGSKLYFASIETITVINAANNQLITRIQIGAGEATGLVISPDDSRLYATANISESNSVDADGKLLVFDTATNKVISSLFLYKNSFPTSIDITPDGSKIYVVKFPDDNSSNSSITVVNTATNSIIKTLPIPASNYLIHNFITKGAACTGIPATFTVTVNPLIAGLKSLTLSGGALSPSFAPTTTGYSAAVSYPTTSINVTPTAIDSNATIKLNGNAITSGAVTNVALATGNNTVTIVVTAGDGITKKTYTVTVTRTSAVANLANISLSSGALSPAFASGTTVYTSDVDFAVTSLQVTPATSDAAATVTVNGTTVPSGTPSAAVPLNVGSNVITVKGIAFDGTAKTYKLTVTRAAANTALTNLAINTGTLSPVFASGTASYTVAESYTTTAIKVTPTASNPNAVIKVNGTTVASGVAFTVPLATGVNTISTVVTDGTATQTYTITVTRTSSVANLANISLSSGTLSPVFAAATTTYTAAVDFAVTSLQVTPTTSDAAATVTVNGTTVPSGTASAALPLNVGSNVITIKGIAFDGTAKTYKITVTRAAANTVLTNLAISAGTLSPVFASGTANYTAAESYTTTSIKVTPTASNPNAVIKVNGTTVASGVAINVPLATGINTISTVVTDGTATQTYTITVTRTSSVANLANIVLSSGTLSPAFAAATTSYTVAVANSVSSVRVTPTTSDAAATVTVNGTNVPSGTPSAALPLIVGSNVITIKGIAFDGTAKTYKVTVTRAAALVGFGGNDGIDKPLDNALAENDNIVVHPALSPNGDGDNDFLTIDGIAAYPDNKLSIMNRSGTVIYEKTRYDNISGVFDGHATTNRKMQSPGTYFYQLQYTVKGETKYKTGFIVLKY